MNKTKLVRYLSYIAALIIVLVPFQALITTWPGANFGHLDLFRIWKELLLVALAAGTLYLIFTDKKLKKWFFSSQLILLVAGYAVLQFLLGFYALSANKVNNSALIYGLIVNLRFLAFFLICLILAARSDWLIKNWQKLILWPAAIVIGFGLLQHFFLPNDFLTHFGYGPKTIASYQTVDQKPQFIRLQSTLRGPNPLGAYLVVIMTILGALWLRKKSQLQTTAAILLSLIVLYFTYSRSAWLGFFVSGLLIAFWAVKDAAKRRWIILGCGIALLILLSAVAIWRHNNVFENTLFHTSQTSQSGESSNAVRTEAMLDGAKSILKQPLGYGPGTAGPASVRNNHPARIAENYFIQIGQEVGIVGLILFVLINLYVAKLLWDDRQSELAAITLSALIGLTIVNLLSHAWADDTLAYIFWGLAGIALGPSVILNKERKHSNAKVKEKAA